MQSSAVLQANLESVVVKVCTPEMHTQLLRFALSFMGEGTTESKQRSKEFLINVRLFAKVSVATLHYTRERFLAEKGT